MAIGPRCHGPQSRHNSFRFGFVGFEAALLFFFATNSESSLLTSDLGTEKHIKALAAGFALVVGKFIAMGHTFEEVLGPV